jgi:hypothetical protein
MSKKILPLTIGMVLLSGSVAAQDSVLFENPYDPQGIVGNNGLGPSNGLTWQTATLIDFSNTSTIQAVSVTVGDLRGYPESLYSWSIYTDVNGMPSGGPGPISGITGTEIYSPIVSGQAVMSSPQEGQSMFSWSTLVPGSGLDDEGSINVVTINTGPVTLGAGDYFFALAALGPGNSSEGWEPGKYDTGNLYSYNGAFEGPPSGGSAITVYGTSAPEIDPSSAAGGITLLFGGLMVLRGRRARI